MYNQWVYLLHIDIMLVDGQYSLIIKCLESDASPYTYTERIWMATALSIRNHECIYHMIWNMCISANIQYMVASLDEPHLETSHLKQKKYKQLPGERPEGASC